MVSLKAPNRFKTEIDHLEYLFKNIIIFQSFLNVMIMSRNLYPSHMKSYILPYEEQ